MPVVSEELVESLRGSHRLGVFIRLDTVPPIRAWLGINDIPAGIASVDATTQETYVGAGLLREVPNLEAVVNGIADRAEFMINGIDPASGQLRDIDAADVRGKMFHIGITTLTDDHQPRTAIVPLIVGRASFFTVARSPVQGIANASVTLSLSVGFGITTRDRTTPVLWSAPHQKAIYPTDEFCDGTSRLERGVNPSWPRF